MINYDDIKMLLPSHIRQLLDRDADLRAHKIAATEQIIRRWRPMMTSVEPWMYQPIAWVLAYLCDLNAGQLTAEYAERSQRQYDQARAMLTETYTSRVIGKVGPIADIYP